MTDSDGHDHGTRGRRDSAFCFLENVEALRDDPLVAKVHALALKKGVTAYVVGGALRNIALGTTPAPDLDFALETAGVEEFSRSVSEAVGGASFALDEPSKLYRVVVKGPGAAFTLDFSPVKEGRITIDLLKRDFTINAMAVDLAELFGAGARPRVIDPANGAGDAEAGLLRVVSEGAFEEDPLRCLRAVRLSQHYALEITPDTERLIKEKSPLVAGCAAERIRDELVHIFTSPGTASGIRRLYELGLIRAVLPEAVSWADVDGYNLLTHTLKTVEEADALLAGITPEMFAGVSDRLKEHFGIAVGTVARPAILKLAAFFHDIGKPLTISRETGRLRFIGHDHEGSLVTRAVLKRLRFSRKAASIVEGLVKNHHRVFTLAKLQRPSPRARANLFRAAGGDTGVDLVLLSIADARATRGSEDFEFLGFCRELFSFYYGVYLKKKPGPVLDGEEIMKTFRVGEGRIIGEIMRMITEGVEDGTVTDKKSAVRYVKRRLEKS